MENKFDKKIIGTREVWTLRLHGKKFMANGDFKSIYDMKKILSANASRPDIYKMEIIRTVENYDLKTNFTTHVIETETLPLWVADEITNAKNIKRANPGAKFSPAINDRNMNAPAIKTGSHTQHSIGLRMPGSLAAPRPIPVSITVFWHELDNNDIVVNNDMNQVYPATTGKMPEILAKFLQNVR